MSDQCPTLRDAIYAANNDGTADTITFQSGIGSSITLTNGALPVNDSGGVTITGPGSSALTVTAETNDRVFNIERDSPNTISGLTITGSGTVSGDGGAIYNDNGGALTLTNDVITGATATGNDHGSVSPGGGGGVYSDGFTTISGTTISGNTTTEGPGGGVAFGCKYFEATCFAADRITGSTITGNTAKDDGGGIDSEYVALTISGSTISSNTSSQYGAGLSAQGTKYGLSVSGSTITGNTATVGGGGVSLYNVDRTPASPKYEPVSIGTTTISGNNAPLGAGVNLVSTQGGSPVTIERSTLSGNQGGSDSFGGGLLVEDHAYAPIKTVDSTISGNSATYGGGVSLGYNGDQTFTGSSPYGSVSFDNSTIASNTASTAGGGIYLSQYNTGSGAQGPSATIRSTIVSGNTAAGSPQDLNQALPSSGGLNGAFSLVQHQGNASFLSQNAMLLGVDPQLGPLQNNGGSTATMMPAGTSPVIDQGHADADLTTDQRGDPRTVPVNGINKPPGGDGTDIGAVELPASAVVVPTTGPAGFTASVRGELVGGPVTPLMVRGVTKLNCSVRTGTLTSCTIQIKAPGGKLLARGSATSSTPVTSLSTHVTATDWGRAALVKHPLGVTDGATVVGQTSASGVQTVTGNITLLGRSIRLGISKQSAKLSSHVLGELSKTAKLLIDAGAKSATCTVYSAVPKGGKTLTKAQAKAACKALKNDGFTGGTKGVGAGYSLVPKRLLISFKF